MSAAASSPSSSSSSSSSASIISSTTASTDGSDEQAHHRNGDGGVPDEVSLVDKKLSALPDDLVKHAQHIIKLDLTGNNILNLSSLSSFSCLETLILDKNKMTMSTLSTLPSMPRLQTLWLNNNALQDVDSLLSTLSPKRFPSLLYLSTLRNPAVPNLYESIADAEAYDRYRLRVIASLPQLNLLDAAPIENEERAEAIKKKADSLKVARPAQTAHVVADEEVLRKVGADEKETKKKMATAPPPKVASFLAKGKPRYDGTNSEGNRFIMNDDL